MEKIQKLLNFLSNRIIYDTLISKGVQLVLFSSNNGVFNIFWEHKTQSKALKACIQSFNQNVNNRMIVQLKNKFAKYFNGKRQVFDILLFLHCAFFDLNAWQVLRKILFLETVSYGEKASLLDDKNKAYAIGLANALNTVSVIVPCQQVISRNGGLTGFGGRLDKKAQLLELECYKS